jgi:hypothetical protein
VEERERGRGSSSRPHDPGGRIERLGVSVEGDVGDGKDGHSIEERRDAVQAPRVVMVPDLEIPSPGGAQRGK